MLTLIYPYRNRDLQRVKRSLDSLKTQSNREFRVSFVDYGSSEHFATRIAELLSDYEFADYRYLDVSHQPWNKSRALNAVVRELDEGYVFVADVDMIFHPQFIERATALMQPDKGVYFKVGFLSETESAKNLPFAEYEVKFHSDSGATGLSLFPVKLLHKIRGFDEFYHFWGSEDSDVHVRLRNAGYQVDFYAEDTLLLHQWHEIYRNKESSELTADLQLTGIVQINYQHLKNAKVEGRTRVNPNSWGEVYSEEVFSTDEEAPSEQIHNSVQEIDAFLFARLPSLGNGIHAFEFREDPDRDKARESLRRIIGKQRKQYYSMKQVNDKLLLHLISFYRDLPYRICVDEKNATITLGIVIR